MARTIRPPAATAALAKVFDFINLMSYDMGTGFSAVSTFNAPLHEVAPIRWRRNCAAGTTWPVPCSTTANMGCRPTSWCWGVPFYGRGFKVTGDAADGLYQPYSAPADAGDWRVIKARYLDQPGWTKHWQAQAQSPWLYNPEQKIFISYEDPRSIGLRAQFAREQGLAGVFMWGADRRRRAGQPAQRHARPVAEGPRRRLNHPLVPGHARRDRQHHRPDPAHPGDARSVRLRA